MMTMLPLSAKYSQKIQRMRHRLNCLHSAMGYALLCEMVARAEQDHEFRRKFESWLINGGTMLIRQLCECELFKKMFLRRKGKTLRFDELAHWNAVHDLDTAVLV